MARHSGCTELTIRINILQLYHTRILSTAAPEIRFIHLANKKLLTLSPKCTRSNFFVRLFRNECKQPKANCNFFCERQNKIPTFHSIFQREILANGENHFFCCCAECRISLWIFAKNRIESKARTRYQRNGITLTAQMTLHHRNREKVEQWKGRGKKRKRTIYSENIEMKTITVCMMLTIPRWRWVIMLTRANQRLRIEKLCSVMKKKTISAANLHPVLCSLSSSIRCRKCGNAL